MFICILFVLYYHVCHSALLNIDNNFNDYYHRKEKCFPNRSTVSNSCIGSHQYTLLLTSLGGSGTHYITCLLQDLNLKFDHERIQEHGAIGWQFAVNDSYMQIPYPHHADLTKSTMNPDYSHNYYKSLFGNSLDIKRNNIHTSYNPSFHVVYHVVRNPLKHIASFTSHLLSTYQFILQAMRRMQYIGLPETCIDHLKRFGLTSLVKLETASGDEAEACIWEYPGGGSSAWSNFDRVKDRDRLKIAPRGHRCWIYFASMSWLFWNKLIDRYSDRRFRIEDQTEDLIVTVCNTLTGAHAHTNSSSDLNTFQVSNSICNVDQYTHFKDFKTPLKHHSGDGDGSRSVNYCSNKMQFRRNPILNHLWNSLSVVMSDLFVSNSTSDSGVGGVSGAGGSNNHNISTLMNILVNFKAKRKQNSIKSSKYHSIHVTNINYNNISLIDPLLSACIQKVASEYGY